MAGIRIQTGSFRDRTTSSESEGRPFSFCLSQNKASAALAASSNGRPVPTPTSEFGRPTPCKRSRTYSEFSELERPKPESERKTTTEYGRSNSFRKMKKGQFSLRILIGSAGPVLLVFGPHRPYFSKACVSTEYAKLAK